jgi:hypothetical protein
VANFSLSTTKTVHGSTKIRLLLLFVFLIVPVLTILIVTFAPAKKTLYEQCQAKCATVNKSFRLEPKGPLTTKERYLQYDCVCL